MNYELFEASEIGHWIHELYERRGNLNCKRYAFVNKQIDTDCRQLNWKLCDLIYLLVASIFCHIRRSIGDFEDHFQKTRQYCQLLIQEIMHTAGNSSGRPAILPEKQIPAVPLECGKQATVSYDRPPPPMLVNCKDDQNVEKLYLYIELPYLCPNYSIFSQVAIYISNCQKIYVQNFNIYISKCRVAYSFCM